MVTSYAYTSTCPSTSTYADTWTFTCTYIYIYTRKYVCIYTHTHVNRLLKVSADPSRTGVWASIFVRTASQADVFVILQI